MKFRTLLPFPTRMYGNGDRSGRRSSILTLDETDEIQVSAKVIEDDLGDGDRFLQLRVRTAAGWAEIAFDLEQRVPLTWAHGPTEEAAWAALRRQLKNWGWDLG